MFVASEDYADQRLSLDKKLIRRPAATFFLTADEDSPDAGVRRGDLLIVDRAEPAAPGKVAVAALDGELRVLKLPPAAPNGGAALELWGCVLWIVRAP